MTSEGRSGRTVDHQIWWQLAVFIAVSALAVYVGMSFDTALEKNLPESRAFPSTMNRRATGYSGLCELTAKVGHSSRCWQLPYRRLKEVKGTLVVIQPDQSLASFEVDQVLDWVRSGNTLIYLDHFIFGFERRLIKKLGFDAAMARRLDEVVVPVKGAKPEFSHVSSIVVTAENRLEGGTALISDEEGAVLSEKKHGDGRVLVGVMPSLCANRRLTSQPEWSNFQLMVNLFGTTGGEILFDEFCHGYSQSSNVFVFLARGPLAPLSFQVLLMALIAVVSLSQRFGSTNVLPVSRRISNLEFVNGLANAYRRARANDLVWEVISHASRSRLLKALGVSPHEPNEKVVTAWSDATGASPGEIEEYLARSQSALEGGKVPDEELIALVASCDKITERSRGLLVSRKGLGG